MIKQFYFTLQSAAKFYLLNRLLYAELKGDLEVYFPAEVIDLV